MATGTALGLLGAVGARYFVSQLYHIPRNQAIIYNAIDMVTSAAAYGVLRKINQSAPSHELAIGILLVSRVTGWFSGALAIDHWGQTELPIMVVLNVSSLVVCWFMRFLSDDTQQKSFPTQGQEQNSPTAPPLESSWKIVYF